MVCTHHYLNEQSLAFSNYSIVQIHNSIVQYCSLTLQYINYVRVQHKHILVHFKGVVRRNSGFVPIPPKPGKIPKDQNQATGNPSKSGSPWKKTQYFFQIFSRFVEFLEI